MKTDCALVIFDPHQNVEWVQRILEQEKENFSHLLLGGDYFDPKSNNSGSIEDTCELLNELHRQFGEDLTLLWGNHDIQYLEAIPWLRAEKSIDKLNYSIPSNFTVSTAREILNFLDEDLLRNGLLFAEINGYLISHAGIARQFWPAVDSTEKAIQIFDEECQQILKNLHRYEYRLLSAGNSRGGNYPIGGITWQDFDLEFSDDLDLPQIFGHTPDRSHKLLSRARQRGRSWCLDGRQSVYGLLKDNGELVIRHV